MIIPPINSHVLKAAEYKLVPVHFDNKKNDREYIRSFDLVGFPRYHVVVGKGKWDLHYDVTAQHGVEYPGSILSEGHFIKEELKRINQTKPVGLIEQWEVEIQSHEKKITKLKRKIENFGEI